MISPPHPIFSSLLRHAPIIVSAVVALSILYLSVVSHPLPYAGHFDFIQYRTASELLLQGSDPYDPARVLEEQRKIRPELESPVMCWNPPWAVVTLSGLTFLRYEESLVLLYALSFLCLIASLYRAHWNLFDLPASIVLAVTFAPTVMSSVYGQLSPVLFFGFAFFAHGVLNRGLLSTGVGVFLMSWKPHLAFLFLFAVLIEWYPKRDARRLQFIIVSMGISLFLVSELFKPGLTYHWLLTIVATPPPAIPPINWIVTSLPGAVRLLLSSTDGGTLVLPTLISLPLGMVVVVVVRILRRRPFDFRTEFPGLLCLTFLFSPYGWFYDAMILLPAYFQAVWGGLHSRSWVNKTCGVLLIALQPITILGTRISSALWHQGLLWWYPILVGLAWVVLRSPIEDRRKNSSADS